MLMGISVANTHGIDAEKNRIEDTETTPTVKRVAAGKSVVWIAGKNISANPLASALETCAGSANWLSQTAGYKR